MDEELLFSLFSRGNFVVVVGTPISGTKLLASLRLKPSKSKPKEHDSCVEKAYEKIRIRPEKIITSDTDSMSYAAILREVKANLSLKNLIPPLAAKEDQGI